MKKYPIIEDILHNIFDNELGLLEDEAIELYASSIKSGMRMDALKTELIDAFADDDFSWQEMLINEDYEVGDAKNENDAKQLALKLLWNPIFDDEHSNA